VADLAQDIMVHKMVVLVDQVAVVVLVIQLAGLAALLQEVGLDLVVEMEETFHLMEAAAAVVVLEVPVNLEVNHHNLLDMVVLVFRLHQHLDQAQ
jgi:hypothetical protein